MMALGDAQLLLQGLRRAFHRRTGRPAPTEGADTDPLWDRVLAQTPELIEEAHRRLKAAEGLRDEILSLEPADRPGRLPVEPRFHSADLLELLLDESQLLQATAPESSAFWAELAGSLAEVLRDKALFGRDSQLHASVLRGNALRLAGDPEGAERAFLAANASVDEDTPEVAFYADALGVLRWEQHRLTEAVSLLEHAAELHCEAQLEQEAGVSQLLIGYLHAETRDPLRGLGPLLKGRCWAGDPPPQPWLSLRGGFLLASGLVEIGDLPLAREVLEETMDLYKQVATSEHETLCAFRLEGAARARLGEIGQAEELLQGVRANRLRWRQLPELVFTSLDLAVVLAELGRGAEIARLAADLQGFEPEEGGVFAAETFGRFETFRNQGHDLRHSAAGAAAEFRRLCRLSAISLEPIPYVVSPW